MDDNRPVRFATRLSLVKLRNTQHEQMSSAVPPGTDVGLAFPKTFCGPKAINFDESFPNFAEWARPSLVKGLPPKVLVFGIHTRAANVRRAG